MKQSIIFENMTNKIRVGIFFGGRSREREVSFAGGRTVYDNLDKSLFEAIPLFVDSFNQLILLDWEYVYKGTIRDFYPPVDFVPQQSFSVQLYADSLVHTVDKEAMANSVGKLLRVEELHTYIDFAFLALHGSYGEDGSLQGLLEWLDIPYTGSGILGTSIGINKFIQKKLAPQTSDYQLLPCEFVDNDTWFSKQFNTENLLHDLVAKLGLPFVIKSANQGSSIGVSFLEKNDIQLFEKLVHKSFFSEVLDLNSWKLKSLADKHTFIKGLVDFREGLGLPIFVDDTLCCLPDELLDTLEKQVTEGKEKVLLRAFEAETMVLFEPFVKGREFSCIVVKDEVGNPVALPPTEIVKSQTFFDYRSKYLPGLSRKLTPMGVSDEMLEKIRTACAHLTQYFDFKVYARIDGFLSHDGNQLLLNDPNTTSGMLPSSFFFHQAAEIGLNPSSFLSYIIGTSLQERSRSRGVSMYAQHTYKMLVERMSLNQLEARKKDSIAVIFGGNSFERHISVESGRNIYEKLNAAAIYDVSPVFLDYTNNKMRFFALPISMMLKDNADDIREKVTQQSQHPYLQKIREELRNITTKYAKSVPLFIPQELSESDLKQMFDGAFIALHGRPGEDGTIQQYLDELGIYYNGSGFESSQITIDKFKTIDLLRNHGFSVTDHHLVYKQDWIESKESVINLLANKLGFPMILKPHDDGCSAAVIKIKTKEELSAYAHMIFRNDNQDDAHFRQILKIKLQDEFPQKAVFLAEKLISANGAKRFLEITGGMYTYFKNKSMHYEVFEPSEALADGEVLSLEEKFLAGQGQNITPARYANERKEQLLIATQVKNELLKVAQLLHIEGYCRIDAFVRIFEGPKVEVIVIEVNSLPGMTPATCIYHQAAIAKLKPDEFITQILTFGKQRTSNKTINQ